MNQTKCDLCDLNLRIPLQCIHCRKLFCTECLKQKYLEEKQLFCPNCRFEQNFDNYQTRIDLISNYSLNALFYPNFDNNEQNYCVQCMKDFTQKDENLHINHNYFSSKKIRELNINEVVKNLNDIMTFQKEIKSHSSQCLKNMKLIESIKKIKLKEIEIMTNNIINYYNNSKSFFEKLYKQLEKTNIKYEKLINNYLIQLNKIIDNNMRNVVKNITETIINDISYISKEKKKLRNEFKQNTLLQTLKFESFIEEKKIDNKVYWNNESFNNPIHLNFNNLIYSPNLSIYQSDNNEIIAKIEMNNFIKKNHLFIDCHLQINNLNHENDIKIPLNNIPNNNNNKLIYEANIGNEELFKNLIKKSPYFSIFISQLQISE